jgi:heparan-alpha-glucosaminide N-acetyltransferase
MLRVPALDALRGLAVVLMVVVDEAASALGCRLAHAPWHWCWPSLPLADLVVPIFLFCAGASVATVATRRSSARDALTRAARLALLGLLLQPHPPAAPGVLVHLPTLRIPGVLQRIAIASLAPHLVFILFEKYNRAVKTRALVVLVIACIVAHLMLSTRFHTCLPGSDIYHPACNAARNIDAYFLTDRHIHGNPTYRRSLDCSHLSPCESSSSYNYLARLVYRATRPAYCDQPFDPEGLCQHSTPLAHLRLAQFSYRKREGTR